MFAIASGKDACFLKHNWLVKSHKERGTERKYYYLLRSLAFYASMLIFAIASGKDACFLKHNWLVKSHKECGIERKYYYLIRSLAFCASMLIFAPSYLICLVPLYLLTGSHHYLCMQTTCSYYNSEFLGIIFSLDSIIGCFHGKQ